MMRRNKNNPIYNLEAIWNIHHTPVYREGYEPVNLYLTCNKINDGNTTVACEVPVYIANKDTDYPIDGFLSRDMIVYRVSIDSSSSYKTLANVLYYMCHNSYRLCKYRYIISGDTYSFYAGSGMILDDSFNPLILHVVLFSNSMIRKRVIVSKKVYSNDENAPEGYKKLIRYIKNKIVPTIISEGIAEVCISDRIDSFVTKEDLNPSLIDDHIDTNINRFLRDNIGSMILEEDEDANL